MSGSQLYKKGIICSGVLPERPVVLLCRDTLLDAELVSNVLRNILDIKAIVIC
jgi:hypothetical protein